MDAVHLAGALLC